jgi:hypothetical protein
VKLGTTQWREVQPRQGCGKGEASWRIMAQPSGIDGCVARASWEGRDTGCGKSPAACSVGGWLGLVGGHALAQLAGAGSVGQVAGSRCPSTGQNRGGERREREREGSGFKLNFL